ncbi:hypothetical protein QF037_000458 [Streptomyces canus]|uniref:hypothetical protein n=1 Tax=Streptomyces canus TaxID=58343 RepID=UPI0027814B66|nr:hypothetical protein [Streptomyces canus]MDQ0596113.1 hypothetical protein [Streptomyces canus]
MVSQSCAAAYSRITAVQWTLRCPRSGLRGTELDVCLQAASIQVGLDRYQVRHWTSWHRHIMLALAFLAADANPTRPADPLHPARGHDPIRLSVPENRHLLAAVFVPPACTADRLLHWSTWRRRHQAAARRSHYQQRSVDEPGG